MLQTAERKKLIVRTGYGTRYEPYLYRLRTPTDDENDRYALPHFRHWHPLTPSDECPV